MTAVSEDRCKSRAGGVTLKEAAATVRGSAAQDVRRECTRDSGAAARNALRLAAAAVRLPAAVRHGVPADNWLASMVARGERLGRLYRLRLAEQNSLQRVRPGRTKLVTHSVAASSPALAQARLMTASALCMLERRCS